VSGRFSPLTAHLIRFSGPLCSIFRSHVLDLTLSILFHLLCQIIAFELPTWCYIRHKIIIDLIELMIIFLLRQCELAELKDFWAVNYVDCFSVSILLVNWRCIRLIDLILAKGKTKVSWLISFHSLIRQSFNILIWHCNPSCIRTIKIKRSKQPYHNNTLPLCTPLPKLGQCMWCQLTKRIC